ncbi:hypothetical protein [Paenibacillus montaniterrae]|uniref:hypothetical protein n=1 Tax=Paenibacillus montaniterrae TaxID=429341 RepID=UPI001FEA1449|nr:hypothetical protein [Paenibacillus montaniterrae]
MCIRLSIQEAKFAAKYLLYLHVAITDITIIIAAAITIATIAIITIATITTSIVIANNIEYSPDSMVGNAA